MKNRYYCIVILLLLCQIVFAQNYSLFELLNLNDITTDAQISISEEKINEYENKLFRIQVFPKLYMTATLPNLTNNISSIALSDGSEKFVNRSYMTSSVLFTANQLIPFTGGTISLSSGLTRLDNYSPLRTISYNFNMFNLSYSQSISTFNAYRWEKKIRIKQNELFNISQVQNRERINIRIIELFFNLLESQKQEELNKLMEDTAKLIYEKAKNLYSIGRISQIDLMDAEIGTKEFRTLTSSLEKIKHQNALITELKLKDRKPTVYFDFDDIEKTIVSFNTEEVITRTLKYSAELQRELSLISEEKEIKKIKASILPSFSLSIGGGYNSQNDVFKNLCDSPSRNLSIVASIGIPILSWNENKIQLKSTIEQSRISYMRHSKNVEELTSTTRFELESLRFILNSIILSKEILTTLYAQLQIITEQFDSGRISYAKIQDLKKEIMQTELKRIENIKRFYIIRYKYRLLSLYDIIDNSVIY